jgi:hypothetical protein
MNLPQGYGDKPMDYGDNPIFLESQMKAYGRACAKVALLRAMEWFYEDEQYEPASSLRRMAKDYE